MLVIPKAFAYITLGRQLLVFRHVDIPAAGIQVPAGTIKPGETPQVGALREAEEETGLDCLVMNRLLGAVHHTIRTSVVHHRHYVHLLCPKSESISWVHWERHAEGGRSYAFEHFWVDFPDRVPELGRGHDAFFGELAAELDRLEQRARTDRGRP